MPAPDPAVLAAAVVTVRSGVPLKIGDFATVELWPRRCARATRSVRAATACCSRSRASSARTRSTSRARSRPRSRTSCRGSRPQGITVYPALHRPATFIERALGEPARRSRARGRDRAHRAVRFLARRARGADLVRHDSAVARRRDARARPTSVYTLNAMTLGGFAVRDRRARRRRDHRRREHHAPLARERVARQRRGRASTSCATRRSRSARP